MSVEPYRRRLAAACLAALLLPLPALGQDSPAPSDRSTGSPMVPVLLIVAVVGAIADRQYVKAGGVRSTTRHKAYLGLAVGLCVILLAALYDLGGSSYAMGRASAFLLVVLFALWEFGRYRVRRANPIPKSVEPTRPNAGA